MFLMCVLKFKLEHYKKWHDMMQLVLARIGPKSSGEIEIYSVQSIISVTMEGDLMMPPSGTM